MITIDLAILGSILHRHLAATFLEDHSLFMSISGPQRSHIYFRHRLFYVMDYSVSEAGFFLLFVLHFAALLLDSLLSSTRL